ncbi:MAG TPA: DUF4062 domain-containing protein [Chitinophagaceae bacterium]|nr:DUF4062 domain-containing protein [Chitinophagaceae bacterium]
MPSFKVYISSTYLDLKEHRKAVRDFFDKFRDKYEVISMEDYVADSELPVDKCVEDVKKCDFYILILANRYGFIPDSSAKFNNPDKLSVTHAEYLAAKENKKKVFAFFAENNGGFETDNDKDPELKKLKADKLTALKEDVQNNYLTHHERFISSYQLALMISESMMKAGEKYADLLLKGARQLIDRYINQDRIEFLDRTPQFNQYMYSRVKNKSPFKPIIIYGEKDSLVESLQKRISNIILNIPKSKIYTLTFNSIFGTGADYEEAKLTFLNAAFQQLYSTADITLPIKSFKELTVFLNSLEKENRIAFVINWSKLVNKDADPRVSWLAKMLKEINDACYETDCRNIFFFININYRKEDEEAFTGIINGLCNTGSKETQFLIALEKLCPVQNGDVDLWIENYITEIPFKKNKILTEYLPELSDEFSMQKAQEKISAFIYRVNSKDPEVLQLLN